VLWPAVVEEFVPYALGGTALLVIGQFAAVKLDSNISRNAARSFNAMSLKMSSANAAATQFSRLRCERPRYPTGEYPAPGLSRLCLMVMLPDIGSLRVISI